MNLLISLDKFDFVIQKEQYDCIIKMMNTISNYQKVLYDYNNTVRYKYFRPKLKVSDIQYDDSNSNNDIENLVSDEIKNLKKNTIIKWWKFAIKMVIRQIKYSKGNENIFKIPDIIRENYKEKFNTYFKIYFKENDNNNEIKESEMNEEEKNEFKKIIELTELKDLYIWSKPVLQEIYTEKKKEEKKNAQKGYFSSWLGSSINEKDLISPEEEEKIEEILSNAVKEATTLIINNEIETKLQLNFELKKGSFKFIKVYSDNNNNNVSEGFNFKYENLIFMMKKGEYFNEIESSLRTFHIDMYTSSNNNITITPITFLNLDDIVNFNNENYEKNEEDNNINEKEFKNDDLSEKKEIENNDENEINTDKKEDIKEEEKKEEEKKEEEKKLVEEEKEEEKKVEEENKEEEKKEEYKEINYKEEIENINNFKEAFSSGLKS